MDAAVAAAEVEEDDDDPSLPGAPAPGLPLATSLPFPITPVVLEMPYDPPTPPATPPPPQPIPI